MTFHHYSSEDGHTILTDNVKLFYPGLLQVVKALQRIQLDKEAVLKMILEYGEFAAKKCDNRPTDGSVVKRISLGLSQKVEKWSSWIKHLPTGEWLPGFLTVCKDGTNIVALQTSRRRLIRSLNWHKSVLTSTLDPSHPPLMSDEFQSYLFGRLFGKDFAKRCDHMVEFMDSFSKPLGGLK